MNSLSPEGIQRCIGYTFQFGLLIKFGDAIVQTLYLLALFGLLDLSGREKTVPSLSSILMLFLILYIILVLESFEIFAFVCVGFFT